MKGPSNDTRPIRRVHVDHPAAFLHAGSQPPLHRENRLASRPIHPPLRRPCRHSVYRSKFDGKRQRATTYKSISRRITRESQGQPRRPIPTRGEFHAHELLGVRAPCEQEKSQDEPGRREPEY